MPFLNELEMPRSDLRSAGKSEKYDRLSDREWDTSGGRGGLRPRTVALTFGTSMIVGSDNKNILKTAN